LDVIEAWHKSGGSKCASTQCFFCERALDRHEHDRYPVTRRRDGKDTVPICLVCHDLKDRIFLSNWDEARARARTLGQRHHRHQACPRHQMRVIKRCVDLRQATIALAGCPLSSERESISNSHRSSSEGTFRGETPARTPIYTVDRGLAGRTAHSLRQPVAPARSPRQIVEPI
jgi:hypothetical protein